MVQYFKFGDKDRPVLFGMAGLYQYEKTTGRNALGDVQELVNQALSSTPSIVLIVDMVHCGLVCGAMESRQPVDFTVLDVAKWISGDYSIIQRVIQLLTESLPMPTPEQIEALGGEQALAELAAKKKTA